MTCLHQVSLKACADINSLTSNQTERGGGDDDGTEGGANVADTMFKG